MNDIVLYIGGFELPDKNAAAHRVLNNAKIFSEMGLNTVFIDVQRDNSKIDKSNLGFEVHTLDIRSTANKVKRDISIKKFCEIYNKYQNNIVAVVTYNYPAIALNRIRKFCKKRNVKLIADVTEWYGDDFRNIYKVLEYILIKIRVERIQKKLDGIIAISGFLYKYYE